MRLFQPAFMSGVPDLNAIVETGFHFRPQTAQPLRVAADTPVAVYFQDASQLPVGRGVEIVRDGPDGQSAAELLVTAVVLRRPELGLPQRALQRGKEMGERLSVVPHVRTGAGTTAGTITAAFPSPQPAILLAQHRGGLQDGEIGGHRVDHLGWQRGIVEAIAEPLTRLTQLIVVVMPIRCHFANVVELPRVPGPIRARQRRGLRVLAHANARLARIPRQTQDDGLRRTRGDRQRHEQRAARRRQPFGDGWPIVAGTLRDVFPGHRQ